MSITSTLSSALSGLNAASRAAELVSSNVANALTEGYARRDLELSARRVGDSGQGVTVTGVSRAVDQVLLSDRRVAEAGAADRDVRHTFLSQLEDVLGTSDDPGSILSRIASFDAALIEAASRPESAARLTAVLDAAKGLSAQIAGSSNEIQTARAKADDRIESEVARINQALSQVADLNTRIRAQSSTGRDASALMDQRQQAVDRIAGILPLREVDRGHGQIALFTTGGALLLDGSPVSLGFTPAGIVTPDMTVGSGALSGLTLNGRAIPTSGPASLIAGGSLAAHFAVRDELAPAAQQRLDAVARDLVERFADPGLDPSIAIGSPGLFTDSGAVFLPANEVGLSQRLSVNPLVDPARGGALWRLRDGMGAAAPGPAGNAAMLSGLQSALSTPRIPVSGGFQSGARSFSGLASDMVSANATARLVAEAEVSFAAAQSEALKTQELQQGVDTDQEMQRLLLIEQTYTANARVIQTVDEMINTLLGL